MNAVIQSLKSVPVIFRDLQRHRAEHNVTGL